MSDGSSSNGGIGFIGLLTILFIYLKLTDHIDWSWWLVLSPILFAIVIWVIMLVIAIILDWKKLWK